MGAITAELVETGEKRDERGRRISSVERREELVRSFHASGLTMAAFARRECVRYSTFAGWVWKSRRGRKRVRGRVRFAEVRLPAQVRSASATIVEVRLIDGTVVRGSAVAEVAALVRALRN